MKLVSLPKFSAREGEDECEGDEQVEEREGGGG